MKTASTVMVDNQPRGLRERIRRAQTVGEIALLLEEGRRYEFAADYTKASWFRAAERRRKELGA